MQYRRSKQRERILQLLQSTGTHPTADWIYAELRDEMPGLSLGTVYRNLGVLIEQGYVRKVPFGSGQDRFEARLSPHYHLVCERCGTIADIELPQYDAINRQAAKAGRFKVLRHRIDFFGICEKCQKTTTTKTSRRGK